MSGGFSFDSIPFRSGSQGKVSSCFCEIQALVWGTFFASENYFDAKKIGEIKKVFPHGVCGRNQHKHVVVLDRIGNIKMQ